MYVEFDVSNHLHLLHIRTAIDSWSLRYQIPVKQKTVRYRHRMGMDHEENFTVFFLTWTGPPYHVIKNRDH